SKTQFNRAIQARRQPGSLFKPFVYVTAMDPALGQQALTASTVLDDSPITVRTGNAVWQPQNYDNQFHGQVTVRNALAHSYNILKDVFNYGTAAKARSLGFERAFAGKTGTTSNYRDAWFIGYSPRILSLVWIGFDDGHSVHLAGGDACVPIWTAHMNRIVGLAPDVDWKRPDDVISREVDPESG